jgi:hypothetical protein
MHTRGVSRDASGRILRAPTTDDDARAVAELITACQLADVGRNEMTIEDLLSVDAESTTGVPRLYDRAGMRFVESLAPYQDELHPDRYVSEACGVALSDLQA